ncbi:MAG TPA: cysteine--tRNA ligase [Candidatus Polarisedimenticolia bacterium]|nr:cysteine--tRNA ligase [Candidatus Polarisedimenticolia bacterium]
MGLRFYNTLTRQEEEFIPLHEGEARLYTCGPTVYDYAHIGNFRTYLWEDLLRRHLRFRGHRVTQVMNLTDVDDKTIANAREAGLALDDYTRRYIDAFFADLDALGIERAEHYPRATRHVPEMVRLVLALKERGHLYESRGSLYFKIDTFPRYGRLARVDPAASTDHTRIDADEYDKDNPRDFAVWKERKGDEPFWETDLGAGRPGWHLECSAMSMKYLGETFDIHTGGVDNIFPHHENEIAQSEAATGRPFVRYWMHAAHLIVDGEKMSKSRGNVYTLRDIQEKGHEPRALRYLLLATHYRKPLNFTFEGLAQSQAALNRLDDLAFRLQAQQLPPGGDPALMAAIAASRSGMLEALDADLNTAGALGHLFDLVREVHSALDAGRAGADDVAAVLALLAAFENIFGVRLGRRGALEQEIEGLIKRRTEARARKDYAESDRIRDLLQQRGIVLEDTPQGVLWKRKGG